MLAATVSCNDGEDHPGQAPGTALSALTEAERARFLAGKALFEKVYSEAEGLGPFFNENQCSACHTVPASGGTTGFERITKATRFSRDSGCDLLSEAGGENIRTQVTSRARAQGVDRQAMPHGFGEVGRFTPPFLFGLGLIEAIPEQEILERDDPDDDDDDGISGRAGRTADGRLARFGRKADFVTIEDFVVSALRLEMGLTTPDAPDEYPPAVAAHRAADPAPDPEVSQSTVDLLTAFVRYLDAPAPAIPRSDAHNDSIAFGRQLFTALGCTSCHTPSMPTGRNAISALDRRRVALYSDLLLHDMGDRMHSSCTHGATPAELRTQPLMGLRHRDRLLFDGRTADLREAILLHGGEAQRSRDLFAQLPWSRQEIVLMFLRSL
jgi:CxxC motif-containing protein (DUF1111 family)